MHRLEKSFLKWIKSKEFPCIGAKAAAQRKCIQFVLAEDMNSSQDDIFILKSIYQYIDKWINNKNHLQSLVVMFKNTDVADELEFEELLWNRLQHLHELDKELYSWDKNVSSDVKDPRFSFSIGGCAFFIVGLHPKSSRKARQFQCPTLVFNLHEQFKKIRENGFFEQMRDKTRANDLHISGSINPMVEDFGEQSEAIQYSGREVSKEYICPFEIKQPELWNVIDSCSGKGFILHKGDLLIVKDPEGQQVADLFCFAKDNKNEMLSSGKTIDLNQTIHLSLHNILYSNLSNAMLTVIRDDVRRHDFLFAPCNKDTFNMLYSDLEENKTGCHEHLIEALMSYNINPNYIGTTFNIFMNVAIDKKGVTSIRAPLSKPGDKIIFQSNMDLIVGLTSCSAPKSNNNQLKPIHYKIITGNHRN